MAGPTALAFALALAAHAAGGGEAPRDDGYRGIWYANQPTGDEHRYKYSGGFATYPQQHAPIAVHAPGARKTFFVYGGRPREANRLLIMASYLDHATGTVPRPAIVLDKRTGDAHENPTLALDADGHLWVFSNAHGARRPAFIHRSTKPHSIDGFDLVAETNFSYGQPWHLPGVGLLLLHTRYAPGRDLFAMSSPDGRTWDEPRPIARVAQGHYGISAPSGEGDRVGLAFNYHPARGGLNARTNLYYLETPDGGRTWRTAGGEAVEAPLTEPRNPALVREYEAEGRLVYLKDVGFDADGHPVLLYLTSLGYEPGPANGPRAWSTARWTGSDWEVRPFAESDHNYDYGFLAIDPDGTWRVVAATDPGPTPFATGGEIVLRTSADRGASWRAERRLTPNSPRNHTYPRRPLHAHPDFFALWADGDPLEPSGSDLYFTDREGTAVWRLPRTMTGESARPEVVEFP